MKGDESRGTRVQGAAEVLEALAAGDGGAWRRFFEAHAARIFRWAVLLGVPARDAEDVVQEVFTTASRRIRRCRADEALPSWLYQITRRISANHRRKRWFRSLRLFAETNEVAEENATFLHPTPRDAGEEIALRRCLRRLPQKQVEVLVLMEIEGYTREETATMLGIKAGTVASRLRLARQAFRDAWDRESKGAFRASFRWEEL